MASLPTGPRRPIPDPQGGRRAGGCGLTRRRLIGSAAVAGLAGALGPDRRHAAAQSAAGGASVEAIAAAHGLRPEQIGFILFDPDSGAPIRAHNADRSFLPASVVKVPTAVMALEVLGPDHRFATEVWGSGAVAGGTLAGNLILVGGGDPFLDTEGLDGLAARLAAHGLRRVTGRLLYDASLLPLIPEISASQPILAQYNPGVGALSVNFNRVQARWQRAGSAVTADVLTISDGREVPADWIAMGRAPGGLDRGIGFLLDPVGDRDGWAVSQSLQEPGALWLPVRNTAWHTASLFARLLGQRGIAVPPPEPAPRPAGTTRLAQHLSVPLIEIAELVLHYSNNLSAELIGLAATRAAGRPAATLAQSAAAMGDWLAGAVPGVDWSGFRPGNHSGLNPAGRVSPRQVAAVLRYAWSRRYGGRGFYDLLRAARFEAALNEGRGGAPVAIRAKTGTLYYGRGLAGYLQAASGRPLGFAVFVSDLAARAAADAAADRRLLVGPPGAAGWLAWARDAEEALVADWALSL